MNNIAGGDSKILVIAPSLPYYDQSSGNRRLFSILEILSNRYEIIYFNGRKGRAVGNNEKYVNDLKGLGIEVYAGKYDFMKIMLNNTFAAAWIEFYYMAEDYLPSIRILRPRCPIIIDSVDIHYFRENLEYNITNNSEDLERAIRTKNRELPVYKKADLVIAVTEEDARILQNDCPDINIDIIPNIHEIPETNTGGKDKNSLLFVGGFAHRPNVDAVIYFCREILPLVKIKIPQITLTIIGSNIPEEIKKLANGHVKVLGYVPSVTPYLQKSYVSIAPLRYGAGMKGKIGEAMAHGIPIVTTSVGVQGMDLVHRENIMIADTPKHFAESIVELITDCKLYHKLSANSVNYIQNNLTPQKVQPRIMKIFGKIEDKPVRRMSLIEKTHFLATYLYKKAFCFR